MQVRAMLYNASEQPKFLHSICKYTFSVLLVLFMKFYPELSLMLYGIFWNLSNLQKMVLLAYIYLFVYTNERVKGLEC